MPALSTGAPHQRVISNLHLPCSSTPAALANASVGLSTGPVDKSLADVASSYTDIHSVSGQARDKMAVVFRLQFANNNHNFTTILGFIHRL